jgi:hypothetical protein
LALSSRCVSLFADHVIVVSEHLAKTLPPQVRYDVIPSGVDLSVFKPIDKRHARTQLGWHPTRHTILFGGDPAVPGKRFLLAKQVVDTLRDRGFDPHLVRAQGIRPRDMPLYINASDVMLLTSAHEGSPNVVKEALACNVPVVSTDVGDVRIRIGEIAGCHVCEESVSTLADAVEEVLERDQPNVEGRITVLGLDERVLAKKVRQIYERVHER